MKEKMKELWSSFKEWCKDIGEMIRDHKTVSLAVVIFVILVIVAVVVSVLIGKGSKAGENALSRSSSESETAETLTVPNEPLQENGNAEINSLVRDYYHAMAEGDTEKIKSLSKGLDEKELIKISEKSEFVEGYPNIVCYTKTGPEENSYLAYVYYEVKLNAFETLIPGLNAIYICRNENGDFYVNGETQPDEVINYCEVISAQDDVVDLLNKVQVRFNEIRSENEELNKFLEELPDILTTAVGEELAKLEADEDESVTETEEESTAEDETGDVADQEIYVKTTDVVNVRSSDSQEADKVGKAMLGDEYKLLEKKPNGWSKILYEGEEAFIKTEFLEVINEEEPEEKEEEKPEENEEEKEDEDKDKTEDKEAEKNSPTEGTATIKETVNLREKASTSSDKLAVCYQGEQLEVIMKQADGWSKVKYKNKTGYVKSEFLE